MTRTKWAERLTPFTAAMALSLLVVALVVKPAWAVNNPQCDACQNYWNNAAQPGGTICQGLTGYPWDQCRWKAIHDNCFKPVAGQTYTEPCYGDPGQPYYTDCSSVDCAYAFTCEDGNKTYTGGTCTGFCYGCDASGNGCNTLQITPPPGQNKLSVCQTYCGCGNP